MSSLVEVIFGSHFKKKFASGNGRLEATEVNIAEKIGGRLASVAVKEGDTVKINQTLARIDTKELNAQLRRAEAEVRRAKQGKNFTIAIIAQRKSELSLAKKDLERSKATERMVRASIRNRRIVFISK